MEKSRTRRYHRPSTKMIALALAVVLVGSLAVNAAVTVKITGGDTAQAATNYLVDNTDYVHKNRIERISDLAGTLGNPTTIEDYYRLASTQIAAEKYEQALSSIGRCLELYRGGDRTLETDLWLKKACLQVILGQDDEALDSLDRVERMDASLANTYLIRAQIYAGREDMVLLAQALESYLALRPQDNDVRALLAQAMFTAGDYEGATAQYREILKAADPEDDVSQTQYLYALTCIQQGDFKTAEQNLSAVLEMGAALDAISYYRGVCRMSLNNYAGAIQDFTVAIQKKEMEQASYYSRGLCRLISGSDSDYDKALADLRKTVRLDSETEVAKQASAMITQLESAQKEAAAATAKQQAEEKARADAAKNAEKATSAGDGEKEDATSYPEAQSAPDKSEDPSKQNP